MRNCWSSLKKVKEESSESAERIQPSFRRETFLRRRDAFLLEFSIRIKYWSNNPSAIDRKLCRTIRWPTMNYENCRAINIFHRDKLVPCTKTAVVCKQRRFLFWTKISKNKTILFSLWGIAEIIFLSFSRRQREKAENFLKLDVLFNEKEISSSLNQWFLHAERHCTENAC